EFQRPGEVRLFDVATGRRISLAVGFKDVPYAVAFSPDGRRLLVACGDGTVKLYDGTTGQEVAALPPYDGFVYAAAFSQDGKTLLVGRGQLGRQRTSGVRSCARAGLRLSSTRSVQWLRTSRKACWK